MKKLFPLFLWIFIIPISLNSQDQPMTLAECVKYAQDNSPKVKRAMLEVNKTQSQVREVLATGLPQVNATGQFLYNYALPAQLLPGEIFGQPGTLIPVRFGTNFNPSGQVEVTQLAYNKTFDLGLKSTKRLVDFQRLFVTKNKDEIAHEVSKMYFQAQSLKKQKSILLANIDQIKKLMKMTSLQIENGIGKSLDLDRLKVNKFNLETQFQNMLLQEELLLNTLKFSMSMPLDNSISLLDTISENYSLKDTKSISPDFKNKVENKIFSEQIALGELNIKRYQSNLYPNAVLFANYAAQGNGNNFDQAFSNNNWFRSGTAGLRISIPLYDGGTTSAKKQFIRAEIEQVRQDQKIFDQANLYQFATAITTMESRINELSALKENKVLSEKVYDQTEKRYKEGLAPMVELVSAETEKRTSNLNYLNALLQIKLSEIEIDFINGKLTGLNQN
jgi:outer membrane protein